MKMLLPFFEEVHGNHNKKGWEKRVNGIREWTNYTKTQQKVLAFKGCWNKDKFDSTGKTSCRNLTTKDSSKKINHIVRDVTWFVLDWEIFNPITFSIAFWWVLPFSLQHGCMKNIYGNCATFSIPNKRNVHDSWSRQ